jgi:hypothetical protein
MRWRTTALLFIVATAFIGGQPHANTAERKRTELAGTTILTGARAGVVRVRLAQEATIADPVSDPAALRISGPGEFAGFALVAEGIPGREGWVLIGGRVSGASQEVHFLDLGGDWTAPLTASSFTLKPGNYSLYLLPGSGPTEVAIRFGGIEGASRLRPARSTVFGYESLRSASTPSVAEQHYTGSAVGALGGKGLVFAATWFEAEVHAATSAKTCFWRNEPPEPHASLPNCGEALVLRPGNWSASSHWVDDAPSTEPSTRFYSGSWHPFRAGFTKPGARYGVSVAVESASLVRDVNSLAFWLTY